MKLEKIKEDVTHFIEAYQQPSYHGPWDWIYDLQMKYRGKRFHAETIKEELQGRFHSNETRRLWKREGYGPARMIVQYASSQPDEVTDTLNDLLDESQELPDRLDRFAYYMDAINARQKTLASQWHYAWHHQDHSIMTYYLALAYPDRYGYYRSSLHERMVERYGAKALAPGAQVDRFQKMIRIIGKYLFDALPEAEYPSLFKVNEMLHHTLGALADPMSDHQ